MKILLNWRYYTIFALFSTGMVSLMISASDPVGLNSDIALLRHSAIYFAVAMLCFFILYRLVCRWERKSQIPEFTNQIPQ